MKLLAILALAIPLLGASACAQAQTSNMSESQIETIVQDYLLNNPAVLRQALENLEDFEEQELMAGLTPDLFHNPDDISIGPKDAQVTIVEFFDYNCGYCKQSSEWLSGVMDKHPKDVRVIFKELPILESGTKTSRNAALAALAAARQGKYKEMHFALMSERGLATDRVEAVAKEIGLDMEMWRSDMLDDALEDQIEDVFSLASRVPGLSGTPFFVIGDQFIPGANTARLDAVIAAELKG